MNTTVVSAGPDPEVNATPVPASPPSPSPPVLARPAGMTPDKAVEKYIAFRDKVAEIKKKHSEELAPYKVVMEAIEGWLLSDLQNARVESMRAEAGTFYKSTQTGAKVTDWHAVLEFVKQNEAWELLEQRVSKLAVAAILQDTGTLVPGVEISRQVQINIRRS